MSPDRFEKGLLFLLAICGAMLVGSGIGIVRRSDRLMELCVADRGAAKEYECYAIINGRQAVFSPAPAPVPAR